MVNVEGSEEHYNCLYHQSVYSNSHEQRFTSRTMNLKRPEEELNLNWYEERKTKSPIISYN